MATTTQTQEEVLQQAAEPPTTSPPPPPTQDILTSYIGISFTLFLTTLPKSSLSLLTTLQALNKDLTFQLHQTQEQLKQLYSRRKEDSKANARVVEIFASHRHAWQQEEKRLLVQIDEGNEEISRLGSTVEELKADVEELKREVRNREEMLSYMVGMRSREASGFERSFGGGECNYEEEEEEVDTRFGEVRVTEGGMEECYLRGEEEMGGGVGGYGESNGFNPELFSSGSKFWSEKASRWQDVQYGPLESLHHLKHFVPRKESPWKVDGESTGVSSKLKLLEQELLNLEKVGKSDVSKVPSQMRKQAKRYQALNGKIDNLCRTMQASDPCEPTLGSEFRTQRQTEFLIEAFRLQQRASETGQKLMALHTETRKSYFGDELEGHAKLTTRRCLDSIKNNFKEIQRNLEIWLARIIGDLEGILSRDGASRVREYYISRFPFVQ